MRLVNCRILLTVMAAIFCATAVFSADRTLPETSPSGILADRVLPLAHLEDLNGSSASPAASPARWRQALHELSRAAEKDLGWPEPHRAQATALSEAGATTVPLALIHADYDRLEENGATTTHEALVLGALREETYYGEGVAFRLDPADIFASTSLKIRSLALDPDDGAGARPLVPGALVSASYAAVGPRTLTVTATLDDGRVLTAKALFEVKRLVTPAPTETWSITGSQAFAGAVASGQAYVYLADGHAGLTNPVVVVEGFDLDNSMDWPVLYDLLNQQNMLEDLRTAGYDAVVLDFTEATEPIQRNAFVLTGLLAEVNAAVGPQHTSVVIGASMGGLVSRYALTWLENQGIDHQVRTWVSFDSPHLGANIPLGLQHWLEFFDGESTEAAFLLSRLDTWAARQMLLHHHLATAGTTAGPDGARAAWLADMAAIGDWPAQPRRVAVANGSGTAQSQGFNPGDQIILYEYRSLLVDIDGDVWSVPDGGAAQMVFDGGMNLIWPLPDTYRAVNIGGTLPWDGAPGGYRGSMAEMDATTAPYGDIIALHDNHCFVPTVSALALAGVGPFHNVAADPDPLSRTFFDQVYYPAVNEGHVTVSPAGHDWFLAEIQSGVTGVEDLPAAAMTGTDLLPAVPNPFNPRTAIGFRLAAPGRVTLRIFDVSGRLVRTLAAGQAFAAGEHTLVWQGHDDAGQAVSSGLYFSRLETGAGTQTGRMVLTK